MIMGYTLESFATDVQRILRADPSPTGREKVRDLVQDVLKDEKFVGTYVNDNTPDRQVIYEDPELGFCICAHVNRDAREANPHDHGSSWAIYGQAFGETEMSDWEILDPAAEGKPGKVRRGRVYALKPGMAHIYNEGDVHSPKRVAATGLLRIEGKNTAKMKRLAYKAV
jgi:predicted metal-dependent enzyme (double-stranded beta helix superfamily)